MPVPEPVYCASEPAIVAAAEGFAEREGLPVPSGAISDALIAAHHPGLGLDRSVCLRDVVDALREYEPDSVTSADLADEFADYVANRFSSSGLDTTTDSV